MRIFRLRRICLSCSRSLPRAASRLGRRAGGVRGPVGAAPSPVRPSGLDPGAVVSRACVEHAFPGVAASSGDGQAQAIMKLSELVGEQDILLGMQADRKRSALGGIAARLAEKVGASQGAVLAALLRLERLGPTSVGQGVAIPHARLDGISAPAAVIATLQRPVAFGSPDDEPVDLLLALLWPKSETKGFVPSLLHVWRLLRRGALPGLLRRSNTPAALCALIESFEAVTSDRLGGVPAESGRAHMGGLLREARALSDRLIRRASETSVS